MKASWYAEALYGALKGKDEEEGIRVFAHFREVLKSRGHSALLSFIPHELEKITERERAHHQVELVTADTESATKWAHAYDHYEQEGIIQKNATRRDVVDPSIVGGFQIRTKELLIDGSYKKPLVQLYKKITNQN